MWESLGEGLQSASVGAPGNWEVCSPAPFVCVVVVDGAAADGRWVIFVGHDIGPRHYQTTDADALVALCEYLKNPANGIWLAPVEEIGTYILTQRSGKDRGTF